MRKILNNALMYSKCFKKCCSTHQ